MKRDNDLIRKMLLSLDSYGSTLQTDWPIPEDIHDYHVRLLRFDGFVWGNPPMGLTAAGTVYLNSIRDDAVWAEVMRVAKRMGGCGSERLRLVIANVNAEMGAKP